MKKLLAGLICLFMIFGLPVLCLANALQAAPTPEHRAAVEAMPPDPTADRVITYGAFGFCGLVLLVVLLKSGQRAELPGGGYAGPDIVRPAAHGPLAPEAQNHWISDLQMREAGHNRPWGRK